MVPAGPRRHNLCGMPAHVRLSAVAVGLALLALLIPYVALKLVVLTAIVAALFIAVLVR